MTLLNTSHNYSVLRAFQCLSPVLIADYYDFGSRKKVTYIEAKLSAGVDDRKYLDLEEYR